MSAEYVQMVGLARARTSLEQGTAAGDPTSVNSFGKEIALMRHAKLLLYR